MTNRHVAKALFACFILGLAFTSPGFGDAAIAGPRCKLVDSRFELTKTPDRYLLLYAGTIVAQIPTEELNDLYGGKDPDLSCRDDFSTLDMIGIVVGWQHDLLIVYGVTRDFSGLPISLNKLGWAPHRNRLSIRVQGSNDFFDLANGVHICWNQAGDGRWSFGTDPGSACTMPPPRGQATETIFAVQI
ncbi:MAG: hypothetical protein E5V37_01840 [Mesorhizobium sp.]|nr:MAG: hypothetical protein E5V37_01840 [Mesorhizobium sp.]